MGRGYIIDSGRNCNGYYFRIWFEESIWTDPRVIFDSPVIYTSHQEALNAGYPVLREYRSA